VANPSAPVDGRDTRRQPATEVELLTFGRLLVQLGKVVEERAVGVLQWYRLTPVGWQVLEVIRRLGPSRAAEIAAACGGSRRWLSGIVDELAAAGLLTCLRGNDGSGDELLALTETGTSRAEQVMSDLGLAFGGAMTELDPTDLRAVTERLARLAVHLLEPAPATESSTLPVS